MKKLMVFATAILLSCTVYADPIPAQLKKSIMGFDVQGIDLKNKTLRIVLNRPVATQDIYREVIRLGVCAPLWLDSKHGWEKAEIEKIEVMNKIQGQGFAFTGGRKSCDDLGSAKGSDENRYFDSHTWVCVAGFPCRPRRDGEKISGDPGQ